MCTSSFFLNGLHNRFAEVEMKDNCKHLIPCVKAKWANPFAAWPERVCVSLGLLVGAIAYLGRNGRPVWRSSVPYFKK